MPYLVQLQRHSDGWGNNLVQQIHVSKDPLIFGRYPEVSFKQSMEPIKERVQAGRESSSQSQESFPSLQGTSVSHQPPADLCSGQ